MKASVVLLLSLALTGAWANSRFVNLSVDVVRDHHTGLLWQTRPSQEKVSFEQARDYCQNLKTDGHQWRLPQVKELASIVDDQSYNPATYHYFRTVPNFHWTHTEHAEDRGFAWLVNFGDGHIHAFRKDQLYYVRCVVAEATKNPAEGGVFLGSNYIFG